jgi:hypothetical protein
MTALQLVLVAVFGLLGTAKVARVPYMVDAATHLGFSTRQYQLIGCVEVLAVTGLVVGFWLTPLAVAAAAGLVLLMLGALLSHIRNGDGARHIAPAVLVLALATGLVLGHL